MTSERWQKIKRLLDASSEIDLERRDAWLEQACGGDETLREEVESYLAYEEDLDSFSVAVPAEPLLTALKETALADEGRLLGPYRLEHLLGHGGMGAVYRAHREAEFEQRVALKLIRPGFETPEILRRFHTERQILAHLEHPNIARLLDGGTSAEGRPYFVMELIEGVPVDRYCDEHRLSIRARLELMLQVCDALRFAHRNLVVHRDLKPSNILVTADGVPKLLDFGIGKVLGQELEETHTETATGSRPLTVSYASPEQLRDQPITTASDLYSLGVIVYELLTGRLPCGYDTNNEAAMVWSICHEEPRWPSVAVSSSETVGFGKRSVRLTPEKVAETRERSPFALVRRLRGDVDAIVGKALQKDPAARYASVEQLAADLRRELDGLPVEARQGSLAYRAGKYARRHRLSLAVATTVLTLILAFTAALSRQLRKTERQNERAERLSGFLVDLFRAAEPDRAGEEPSVRELVDIGRERLESELEEEPEVRAELLGTLGQVYYRLGHYAAAEEAHKASIAVLQRKVGRDHPILARAWNDLSAIAYDRGDHAQAEAYSRESIAMRERLGDVDDLSKPRNNLATILVDRGKLEEAEVIYHEILASRRATLGARHPNVAKSLRHLARVLYLRGDLDGAEPLFRESLEIRLEAFGRKTDSVAKVLVSLGRLAHARGDLDAAEALYHEVLEIRRLLLGHDHLSVATVERDLAELLLELDEVETAGVLLANAFGPIYRHKPDGDWVRADLESVYGVYLAARGRLAEAEVCLAEGYRVMEEVRGPHVRPVRDARQRLADFARVQARASRSSPSPRPGPP